MRIDLAVGQDTPDIRNVRQEFIKTVARLAYLKSRVSFVERQKRWLDFIAGSVERVKECSRLCFFACVGSCRRHAGRK